MIYEKFLTKKSEIFIEIALVLFVFSVVIQMTVFSVTSNGDNIEILETTMKAVRYLAYALCVLQICIDRKVKASWIIYVIIVAGLLAIGTLMVNSRTMFLYFWLIAAASGVSDKKILRTIMWVQIGILCVTVISSQIGIVQDIIDGDRVRHYLGFTWTTYAPILFFFIVLQYLYICDLEITFLKFIFAMIINIWLFSMTNTRFVFVLLSVMLIIALLYSYTPIKEINLAKLKYLFILAPEGIALFSIGLHAFYDSSSSGWSALNDLLSGRLRLGYNALNEFEITLFGQDIAWYGNGLRSQVGQNGIEYNYVDCSYLQILLQYGLIFLILVLLAFSIIMWKAIEEKRYSACWIILMILILAITEPWLVNIGVNPFILLVFTKAEPKPKVNNNNKTNLILVYDIIANKESMDA